MSSNGRTRNFCMVFYDEDLSLVKSYLEKYTSIGVIEFYAFIHHQPDGEEKQHHFHAVFKTYNPKTVSAITKRIGVRDGKVKICGDFRLYCRYLLHLDDPDKIRYYPLNVCSNDMERYRSIITAQNDIQLMPEKLYLLKAYKLIDEYKGHSYADIIKILTLDKSVSPQLLRKCNNVVRDYYYSRIYNAPTEKVAQWETKFRKEANERWERFIKEAEEKGVEYVVKD